jgi:hypothetical protein
MDSTAPYSRLSDIFLHKFQPDKHDE